nr:integrase, catalytic region, zinc finger, CCHC-type, peptidase aspartic, catalytic [Tanacetum cinerariifolium]
MTTLAEHIIVVGAENRPPMLEKSMYDSLVIRICLFIKWNKNGMMMLDSINEGPLVYPTVVGGDGHTRPKKYSELAEAQQLQDDCDVQATNIILYSLPPEVYSLTNHQEAAKDIWDIVKLLIKGTELSYQELLAVITPEHAISIDTPFSTTIDQDAPSTKLSFKESSSQVIIPNNMHSQNQPPKHINKWTKDYLIDNVIGDPSRPISTRHQLQDEALLCYFDAFLSLVEPKSYKEALTESSWIEAMQEALNEFEHLKV